MPHPIHSASTRPLEARLAEQGPFPEGDALVILRAVLDQIRALHASGRVHRAINPDTVCLDTHNQVTLTAPGPTAELGGPDGDLETCPPELRLSESAWVPEDLETAPFTERPTLANSEARSASIGVPRNG